MIVTAPTRRILPDRGRPVPLEPRPRLVTRHAPGSVIYGFHKGPRQVRGRYRNSEGGGGRSDMKEGAGGGNFWGVPYASDIRLRHAMRVSC